MCRSGCAGGGHPCAAPVGCAESGSGAAAERWPAEDHPDGVVVRLRPCQVAASIAVQQALRAPTCAALVRMVTRGGKSLVIAAVLHALHRNNALPPSIGVVTSRTLLVDDLHALLSKGAWTTGRLDGHRHTPGQVLVTTYASLHLCPPFDLLICDEAHRTKGKRIRRLIAKVPRRVGFSATPHGARDNDRLPFDTLVYNLTYQDAVDQQVIVPWVRVAYDGPPVQAGDDGLLDPRRVLPVALDMLSERGGPAAIGPVLFSAPNLATAAWMAEQIRQRGWSSEAAIPRKKGGEGLTRKGMRRLLERFGKGEVQTLVTVDWLAEGITVPSLRALVLCAQPRGRVHLCQLAGRTMGTCQPDRWGEKTQALIFDPAGVLVTHRLEHAAAMGDAAPERPRSAKRAAAEGVGEVVALPYVQRTEALQVWSLAILEAAERLTQVDGKGALRRLSVAERGMPATAEDRKRLRDLLPLARWVCGPAKRGRTESAEEERERALVGERHRAAIKALAESPEVLPRGVVQDLVDALVLVARCREGKTRQMKAAGRSAGLYAELAARGVVRVPASVGVPGL